MESRSLKSKAVSGVKWMGMSAAFTTSAVFIQIAVLAHLLVPEDFGLMGMVMVLIGFAQAFSDMGISKAIIYRQDATREELSSLYWLNLLAGIIVFSLTWAAAPLAVAFYNEPRLYDLMRWAAVMFLVIPLGQQFQILLEKELQFNQIAKVDIAAVTIGAIFAVSFAIAGQGVFALVWGELAKVGMRSMMLLRIGWPRWRPGFRFKIRDLKGYLGFGLYQMGEGSVNIFSAKVDYLIIGKFLGPTVLGAYMLAYQLVVMPLIKINPIMTRVAFPVFAKKQSDDLALRSGYLQVIKFLALIILPLLTGLAVTASLVVPLVFGEGWEMAIPLIQILAVVGMLKSLGNPVGSVLLAKGRVDIGFKWNLFVALANTIVFWLAVQRGVYAVAWSYLVLSVLYTIIVRMILQAVIGLPWRDFVAILIRPFLVALGTGATVAAAFILWENQPVNRLLLLMLLVALGMVVDILLISVFERRFILDKWKLLRNKTGGA